MMIAYRTRAAQQCACFVDVLIDIIYYMAVKHVA